MSRHRKVVFRNGYFYHIFNRGIEKQTIFSNKRSYVRMMELIEFYSYKSIPIRYSKFKELPKDRQQQIHLKMMESGKLINIICFCLMPNHFHFLLEQIQEDGIKIFVSNITNAFAKYFNTKNSRQGTLFQGPFKSIFVETSEQLIHLVRYIHLNPVMASLIEVKYLDSYQWSSHPHYLDKDKDCFVQKAPALSFFKNATKYNEFIRDQVEYANKLHMIKHEIIEN